MKLVETHANLLRSNASSAQKFEIINQNLQKSDLEKNSIFDFLLEHGIKNINNEKDKIGTVNSPHRIQSIISYIQNIDSFNKIEYPIQPLVTIFILFFILSKMRG